MTERNEMLDSQRAKLPNNVATSKFPRNWGTSWQKVARYFILPKGAKNLSNLLLKISDSIEQG